MQNRRIWLRFEHAPAMWGRHQLTTYWPYGRETIVEMPSPEDCEDRIINTVLSFGLFPTLFDQQQWNSYVYHIRNPNCPDCGALLHRKENGIRNCYLCGYSECG